MGKRLQPIYYDEIILDEVHCNPEPKKVFPLSPFSKEQVKYLKGLVLDDNSTDSKLKEEVLELLISLDY